MTVVVDASTVVAALVDDGDDGAWAERMLLRDPHVAAPHLLPVEVTNVLRRAALGPIDPDDATAAHLDLLELRIDLFPYEPLARRVWELRANLTAYDAWYVALAEALDAPLATLDRRLRDAPGPRCSFLLPR